MTSLLPPTPSAGAGIREDDGLLTMAKLDELENFAAEEDAAYCIGCEIAIFSEGDECGELCIYCGDAYIDKIGRGLLAEREEGDV
jgi:hypothetical protein